MIEKLKDIISKYLKVTPTYEIKQHTPDHSELIYMFSDDVTLRNNPFGDSILLRVDNEEGGKTQIIFQDPLGDFKVFKHLEVGLPFNVEIIIYPNKNKTSLVDRRYGMTIQTNQQLLELFGNVGM